MSNSATGFHGHGMRKKKADTWGPPVRGAKETFHASVSYHSLESLWQWRVGVGKIKAMIEKEDEFFDD
jgi:hypothetical protein